MLIGGARGVLAVVMSGLLIAGLGACDASPEPAEPGPVAAIEAALTGSTASDADVEAVAGSLNEFGVQLYAEVAAARADEPNLVVSPASVSQVLVMLLAATDGQTHEQLRDVLHLTLPDDRFYPALAQLWADVVDGGYTVENANWGVLHDSFSVNPEYVRLVAEHLDARFQTDSFADPQALAQRVNDEVAERTHDVIPSLVTPQMLSTPNLELVLLNAVYFRGSWATEFVEGETETAPFMRADGSRVQVAMMSRPEVTSYLRADGYTAVGLPYEGGASMLLVLPDPDRFEEVAAALDADALAGIRDALAAAGDQQPRELRVPRFEADTEEPLDDLKPAVTALGAPALFDFTQDWIPLQTSPQPLSVSFLVHRAAIRVGEKGTEAAGATAAGIVAYSVPEVGPITFDRPFLFSIADDTHGAVLFLGHIGDPPAA
jgi:serpin B